jgi:hypothetical protein
MFDSTITDEEATPLSCGACGGDFARSRPLDSRGATYSIVTCVWCWRGTQTPSQREVWECHRERTVSSTRQPLTVKESGVRLRTPDAAAEIDVRRRRAR